MTAFAVLARAICQLPQPAIPCACRRGSERDFASQEVRNATAGAADGRCSRGGVPSEPRLLCSLPPAPGQRNLSLAAPGGSF